jgi:hypothetical protein
MVTRNHRPLVTHQDAPSSGFLTEIPPAEGILQHTPPSTTVHIHRFIT